MPYSPEVLDHFTRPRNVGSLPAADSSVGTGTSGAPDLGDFVKLQIRVDPATGTIVETRFKTFGCPATIACASMASEWLKGRGAEETGLLTIDHICRVLRLSKETRRSAAMAEEAVRVALADYRRKQAPTR